MSVVLVTGCSSGFGLAIALAFAQRGDQVVATLRDTSRTPADLASATHVQQLDVTDAASINTAVRNAVDRFGRIDVLVNNAGIGLVGALEAIDAESLRRVFDTNVFGATAVTNAVLPHMRAQHSGRVIFVNAIGGVLTTAFLGAYCASKHALDCLAAVYDLELRPFGIRVSSVYPGAFQTAMSGNNRVIAPEDSPYGARTREYHAALRGRMRSGDLSPVVDAVVEAATSSDPRLRYLVASPQLTDVLTPPMAALDALHVREISMTPGLTSETR